MARPIEEQAILVTGATDGLGRAVAAELARLGATVLLHGRSAERGEQALAELRRATGSERLHLYLADLSSLGEVRRLGEEIESDHERLDVLVNNAGIIADKRALSQDGHELTFAVNHLSHFLLTELLLPLLQRSAPARIVNVASIGQSPIDFENVMLERGYDGFGAYAQSKLAQIMFTFELAARLRAEREDGVTVNALHPATLMDTKMVRQSFGRARTSVEEGVEAVVRLAVAADVEGVSGRYFDGLQESTAQPQAYDAEARRRLWELSEELTRP
ncbi:MAG: SDR family NAD(P)-dependent oxidoreductase [Thermoleophilaceae bacterium]|jgi:NAD(P)-dependent dehydrogenase (short-subunit alcohol dehydrogenase family)|nr:SDR family NAD(P)-dependent oxidoreductase [Thermoleophilaceae bacterium]